MALRAQTRAYYLRMCEWNRLALGSSFFLGAVILYPTNFANTLAKVGVAYAAGFMVLIAVSKAPR